MRLNKTNIDQIIPPQKGQAFYRDDLLVGFGLRAGQCGYSRRVFGKILLAS